MERLTSKRRNALVATALSAAALAGCSIDSYLADVSDVQCDGKRTKAKLNRNGMATFIVHGDSNDSARVQVRRSDEGVSVGVSGNVTGSPEQLDGDGFTPPTPLVEGAELSASAAGGNWVIDVREDSVVIQGSCGNDNMPN